MRSNERTMDVARPRASGQRRLGRWVSHLAWFLALCSLLLVPVGGVAAEDDGPGLQVEEGAGPPRRLEREAPERAPRILERTVSPEGHGRVVIELPAEADAYIASGRPETNFGTSALWLGYNLLEDPDFAAERMLLRFDVRSSIPEDAAIDDARLVLYLNVSSPEDDPPMPTELRQTASPWEEDAVTWNQEPEWGPVRAENEVGSEEEVPYEWEVTDLVADWVSGSQPNHGVEILCDEREQQRERAFYSRETTNDLFPRLVVEYHTDVSAPRIDVDPLPTFVDRDFRVSWSGSDPGGSGIASVDVQYRVDGGAWADWIVDADPTGDPVLFAAGLNGRFYEFRARGEDRAGNVELFGAPEASTTVDAAPPTSEMDPLPTLTRSTRFVVSWSGDDHGGSGIRYFDVRYRFNGGAWEVRYPETITTTTSFRAAEGDGVYDFEVRAVDELGFRESFTGRPEASIIVDAEAPFVVPRVWLPLVLHAQ